MISNKLSSETSRNLPVQLRRNLVDWSTLLNKRRKIRKVAGTPFSVSDRHRPPEARIPQNIDNGSEHAMYLK